MPSKKHKSTISHIKPYTVWLKREPEVWPNQVKCNLLCLAGHVTPSRPLKNSIMSAIMCEKLDGLAYELRDSNAKRSLNIPQALNNRMWDFHLQFDWKSYTFRNKKCTNTHTHTHTQAGSNVWIMHSNIVGTLCAPHPILAHQPSVCLLVCLRACVCASVCGYIRYVATGRA